MGDGEIGGMILIVFDIFCANPMNPDDDMFDMHGLAGQGAKRVGATLAKSEEEFLRMLEWGES